MQHCNESISQCILPLNATSYIYSFYNTDHNLSSSRKKSQKISSDSSIFNVNLLSYSLPLTGQKVQCLFRKAIEYSSTKIIFQITTA